jgi:hypothetical protein
MNTRLRIAFVVLLVALLCAVALAADFAWDWHDQRAIGRDDLSVGTTSQLTEPERAALVGVIVARLQKPMTAAGYDAARIREIASITRIRFAGLGGNGKPLVLATSPGLEGGCDAMSNCPFWIFRHDDNGYSLLLDTVAATYTIQPTSTDGLSDLVILRHISAQESRLTLYRYSDGKYAEAGCYTATWPPPQNGEVQEPTITPCAAEKTGQ